MMGRAMLYRMARSLLFQMDAERAHDLGLWTAAMVARRPRLASWLRHGLARPADQPIRVAGLTFPNPIGLAAGLDKDAAAPLAWWAMGFGFMELGTVTPRPQPGKPHPRLFRHSDRLAIVNRMGFNNDGAAAVAARLETQCRSGLRPGCPIGLSIGKNAATSPEHAADDYAQAAAALSPHADYLAINVSSPNTPGLRDLQTAQELVPLVRVVHANALGRPIFVKIAPELGPDQLPPVLDACIDAGVAGIIATNTLATLGRNGLEEGGLSGRPLREISLRQVERVRRHAGQRLAVIGCGGVDDGPSARALLDAGADLVQLYTGLIYRGPFLPARITRELERDQVVNEGSA